MCELFGVSYARERVVNSLLSEFFSHGNEHPHGWGMAFFQNGSVQIEKQPVCSRESAYLASRLETPITADVMLGHIRLATMGVMDYSNTHPFVLSDITGRNWTQVHNGTILRGEMLAPYLGCQGGQTDSERILLCIVDRINRTTARAGRVLSARERFAVVEDVIREITPDNKVNLLLYDGELLYVHSNLARSLYQCTTEDGVVISTQPLGNAAQWKPVPFTRLVAYREGALTAVGSRHNNVFVEDEECRRMLFARSAALCRPAVGAACAATC